MRVHTVIAVYVLFFALFLGLTRVEYALLILCAALVLVSEAFNSSIEALCNRICPQKDEIIRNTKDMAAGAVLLAAVFAVIMGLVLLLRPRELLALLTAVVTKPLNLILLLLSAALSFVYIIKGFGPKNKN